MLTRRHVFALPALAALAPSDSRSPAAAARSRRELPLDGKWRFRTDPDRAGESQGWFRADGGGSGWTTVRVPHTWNATEQWADYMGVGWYAREFDAPPESAGRVVRADFQAIYHSAVVWVNGARVASRRGFGYTPLECDITSALRPGRTNTLVVRVDNSFDAGMLPRGRSFDWAADGGITRPAQLLVTPEIWLERVEVDAVPDLARHSAEVRAWLVVRNASRQPARVSSHAGVYEEETGRQVAEAAGAAAQVAANAESRVPIGPLRVDRPLLWHFDHPHLYSLEAAISVGGTATDVQTATFGIRSFEVRGGAFHLNGERVRLAGLERMAGSNPQYGMAEPSSWIEHDHADMKNLNCVFTRVHWPQDRRVLDYCDRHGIMIQLEVPAWGPETFQGMTGEPSPAILENGLAQLRALIARDRNHPSVFAWGLCNEINGQNPPAREFVRRLYAEAKRLDPHRPCTYASNSLQKTPERDVAGDLDFISWNEYYESWYSGGIDTMQKNLEAIHAAFPSKPIVISEYGYCECNPKHTGGDEARIRILRDHNAVFREHDWVGGLIFFCYNDYRTHMGDKGVGTLKQRVHGVVDVYGSPKPSYDAARTELGPVESLRIDRSGQAFECAIAMRTSLPAYTAEGYKIRWTVFGFDGLPMEQHEEELPALAPGAAAKSVWQPADKTARRLRVDVVRPTGFSTATAELKIS